MSYNPSNAAVGGWFRVLAFYPIKMTSENICGTYCHGYIMLTTVKPGNHGSENREHFNYILDITCVSFMIIIRIFF